MMMLAQTPTPALPAPAFRPHVVAPAATPEAAHSRIAKTVLEGLLFMIRGGEGLDLPAAEAAKAKLIHARVTVRLGLKEFPAITPGELRAFYNLSAKAAPSVFRWFFSA